VREDHLLYAVGHSQAYRKIDWPTGYPDAGWKEDERADSHLLRQNQKFLDGSSKFHFTFVTFCFSIYALNHEETIKL
jgi:hypothetical protein